MSKQQNHLSLRGNTWHVRLDVPADVRPHFGHRRVLSESLKTGDKRLANERGALLIAQWKREIRAARGDRPDLRDTWAPDIVRGVGNFEAVMEVLLLRVARRQIPDPVEQLVLGGLDSVASEWQADDRSRIYRHLKQLVKAEGTDSLDQFLRPFADDDNPDPVARFDALRLFLHRTLPHLWTQKYRLNESEHLEAQALVRQPESYRPKSPYSASLREKFYAYLATQVKDATLLQYRVQVEKFSAWLEHTGNNLDYKSVELFLNSISTNAVTRKGYLAALIRIHKWLLKNDDYYPRLFPDGENPFHDHVHAKRGKDGGEDWAVYSREQVEELHTTALNKGDRELADLIALSAYTGCRIAELGWLRLEHVETESGEPVSIKIVESKTKSGIRTIPISSRLVPVVKRLMANPHGKYEFLLPGPDRLPPGRLRIPSLTERFTKLKNSLGHSDLEVFHSIRKCFATELENKCGDPLAVIRLMGHEVKHLTFDTYSGGLFFARAKTAIETLQFDFKY